MTDQLTPDLRIVLSPAELAAWERAKCEGVVWDVDIIATLLSLARTRAALVEATEKNHYREYHSWVSTNFRNPDCNRDHRAEALAELRAEGLVP